MLNEKKDQNQIMVNKWLFSLKNFFKKNIIRLEVATFIGEQGDPQGFVRFTGERLEPDFQANVRHSQLSPNQSYLYN